jgi:hypothetical protein
LATGLGVSNLNAGAASVAGISGADYILAQPVSERVATAKHPTQQLPGGGNCGGCGNQVGITQSQQLDEWKLRFSHMQLQVEQSVDYYTYQDRRTSMEAAAASALAAQVEVCEKAKAEVATKVAEATEAAWEVAAAKFALAVQVEVCEKAEAEVTAKVAEAAEAAEAAVSAKLALEAQGEMCEEAELVAAKAVEVAQAEVATVGPSDVFSMGGSDSEGDFEDCISEPKQDQKQEGEAGEAGEPIMPGTAVADGAPPAEAAGGIC